MNHPALRAPLHGRGICLTRGKSDAIPILGGVARSAGVVNPRRKTPRKKTTHPRLIIDAGGVVIRAGFMTVYQLQELKISPMLPVKSIMRIRTMKATIAHIIQNIIPQPQFAGLP